jgi:protein O-mannosyl-transferase
MRGKLRVDMNPVERAIHTGPGAGGSSTTKKASDLNLNYPLTASPQLKYTRLDWVVASCLAAATLITFAPAFRADFVGLDDPLYVQYNRHVTGGLTIENIKWAWTTYYQSNWHPLTWLSLQIDATLYNAGYGELSPAGFHATNIFLHAANAVLLYFALRALTGCRWRSCAASALFTLHPLRVESVAWVSERKDVLSIFFGLGALWAYAAFVRDRRPWRYVLIAGALTLSLLSKPMLVTFPFLLLVLDWWPLERVKSARDWRMLLIEKMPLIALCLASSIVAYHAQQAGGSMRALESLPISRRLANAIVAYATYLALTVWPAGLAPYYPYQENGWPVWRVTISLLLMLALTVLAVQQRRRRPFLTAGWLWYVGTLVPVLGLVQVGNQAFADRYTYFPSIGLFLAVAWIASDLIPSLTPAGGYAMTAAAAIVLGALSFRQTSFWRNDFTLWPRTLKITGDNAVIYNAYGAALEHKRGKIDEAMANYKKAVETQPYYSTAHYNIGHLLQRKGRSEAAMEHFKKAIDADQHAVGAYIGLGEELMKNGNDAKAKEFFSRALEIEPDSASARADLGLLFQKSGRLDDALEQYLLASRYNPANAEIQFQLGVVLAQTGRLDQAINCLRQSASLLPGSADVQLKCGIALDKLGRKEEAIPYLRRAVELNGNDMRARLRFATALARLGDKSVAREQYEQATRIDPDWRAAMLEQAWLRAASPIPGERNAEDAVWAAESVCYSVQNMTPVELDVLAAALAEAGRFPEAAKAAEKALAAAESDGQRDLARAIAGRLALYRDGRPFRAAPRSLQKARPAVQ